jgi:hypothetical protein
MSRIQIENGYTLCVLHRKQFTHLLLEQLLPDGSIVLHGEKKLESQELAAFLSTETNSLQDFQAAFNNQS